MPGGAMRKGSDKNHHCHFGVEGDLLVYLFIYMHTVLINTCDIIYIYLMLLGGTGEACSLLVTAGSDERASEEGRAQKGGCLPALGS